MQCKVDSTGGGALYRFCITPAKQDIKTGALLPVLKAFLSGFPKEVSPKTHKSTGAGL